MGVTDMIIQSNSAIISNTQPIKISGKRGYDGSPGFADSIARLARMNDSLDVDEKSTDVASKETDPVKMYEEMTMRSVNQIQRSSKMIGNVEWCDKTLALFIHGDVDVDISSGAVNWNSTGDATLTNEQITELHSKYNLNNLSSQDFYDLMVDLSNMNVISAEDIKSMFVVKAPPAGSYVLVDGFYGSVPFGHGNIFDSINSDLNALSGVKNFMLSDEFWKMNPNASKDEHSSFVNYINNRANRFNRLLQIFTSIRG